MTGFYNRGLECSLRGTDCTFTFPENHVSKARPPVAKVPSHKQPASAGNLEPVRLQFNVSYFTENSLRLDLNLLKRGRNV